MLAITNALYRDLILSSQTALCVTDTNCTIQLVNPAFTRLYGYEESEIIGQSPTILEADRSIYVENGVYQGEYDRLVRGMQEFFNSPEDTHWEGKVLHRCKDDNLTWVKQRLSPVRDESGTISGYLWATENIAEEPSTAVFLPKSLACRRRLSIRSSSSPRCTTSGR
ncbi:MAG: PAS domain-containing protein [Alkalispirochaeta sp.]